MDAASGQPLEIAQEIHGQRLRPAARGFASPPFDGEVLSGRFGLAVTTPATLTTIAAIASVHGVESVGCPTNSAPTRTRASLSGFFFKTDPGPSGVSDGLAFVRSHQIRSAAHAEAGIGPVGLIGKGALS